MRLFFILVSVFSIGFSLFGQTPGGASAGLVVWLKADESVFSDAGSTSSVNAGTVQQWNNLAPAATLHAIQTTLALQPVFTANGYNYNPVLTSDAFRFLTIDELDVSTATSGIGMFVVYNYNNVSQGSFASGPLSTVEAVSGGAVIGNVTFESSLFNGGVFQGRRINVNGSGENPAFSFTSVASTSVNKNTVPALHVLRKSNSSNILYQFNGAVSGSATSGGNFVYSDINVFRGWRNASAANTGGQLPHIMSGNIAEIVMYSGSLTNLLTDRIETYLALKYGLTLAHNYINTSDVTVYDVSNYNQDIIGIARNETDEEFLQKQSHTTDDIARIFTGSLATTNQLNTTPASAFGNDKAYLIMGRDAGVMCTAVVTAAEKPASVDKRLDREWKITNTDFNGNFNVSLDISGCTDFNSLPAAQILFLVDDDGDFMNATVYPGVVSLASGRAEVNITNLQIPANNTRFITLGSLPVGSTPVRILGFRAVQENQFVKLTWQTATEPDDDFILEKSQDGISWITLKTLKINDLDKSLKSYFFTDENPFSGINYYRIRQSDDESFTKTISIFVKKEELLKIFPNPAGDFLFLEIPSESDFNFKIYNSLGITFPVLKEKQAKGYKIKTDFLAAGTYFLTVSGENSTKTFVFVKQ